MVQKPLLRVLGLTGPIGSGCTYLSQLFNEIDENKCDGNRFLRLLVQQDEVFTLSSEKNLHINWSKLNKSVAEKYAQRRELRKKLDISKTQNNLLSEQLQEEQDRLYQKIINDLELREAYHALTEISSYYSSETHLFHTISVSDLIVLRVIRNLAENPSVSTDTQIPYQSFCKPLQKLLLEVNKKLSHAGLDNLTVLYDQLDDEHDIEKAIKLVEVCQQLLELSRTAKQEIREAHPDEYTDFMQDFGDNLRRCGNSLDTTTHNGSIYSAILAEDTERIIKLFYNANKAAFFVIDCLRNPFEIIHLRKKFANFFLISVYADKSRRVKRRMGDDKSINVSKKKKVFEQIDKRDSGEFISSVEELCYRQNITKCVQISDIAINNGLPDEDDKDVTLQRLYEKIVRIICLILSPGCTKPTYDEMYMNAAYAMAVRSYCICRQVGAVILSKEGCLLGGGYNDVGEGRISCGLRAIEDLSNDEFVNIVKALDDSGNAEEVMSSLEDEIGDRQFCFCLKDFLARKKIEGSITKEWKKILANHYTDNEAQDSTRAYFEGPAIKTLLDRCSIHQLEYCLALHAEENAILQTAKVGGVSMKNSTIYVTAHPCPLCQKKIQQVGINRVVYTDPYPESFPRIYLQDVIANQFEGVKPRSYIRLFMPNFDQKELQKLENMEIKNQ